MFTVKDLNNAKLYAENRLTLHDVNRLYDTYPHLISWSKVHIRSATNTDFFIPLSIKNKCIIATVDITEKLCEKLKCDTGKINGTTCTPDDVPILFRVGDTNDSKIVCQPACFNLRDDKTYTDGIQNAQSYNYHWNENTNSCVFLSPAEQWMLKPVYRSDTKFEKRLNDFETGFNIVKNPNMNSGYSFNYNKFYCDQFEDDFNESEKICEVPGIMVFADAIIGANLINSIKSAIRDVSTSSYLKKLDLPPIGNAPKEAYYDFWRSDINPNFKKFDTDLELENSIYKTFNSDYQRAFINHNTEPLVTVSDDGFDFNEFLDGFTISEEFLKMIGIDVGMESLMEMISRFGPKLIKVLNKAVLKVATKIFTKVITKTISATIQKSITMLVVKLISKLAIALIKLGVQIASIYGIVTAIITVIGLIFDFWDPYGYNNKYPPDYLDDVLQNMDLEQRSSLAMQNPSIDWDILNSLLSTTDEILDRSILSLTYIYEYLDALTVNSEGSRVDKGVEINAANIDENVDKPIAELNEYSYESVSLYEKTFSDRILILQGFQICGFLCIGIGSTCVLFGGLLFALLFLVIGIILLSSSLFLINSNLESITHPIVIKICTTLVDTANLILQKGGRTILNTEAE